MSHLQEIEKLIKENDALYVDFRFTDFLGKSHHITHAVESIDLNLLQNGIMFDGSSIMGWKNIHESDTALIPDLSTAQLDPFSAQPTLIILCDVYEPLTSCPYNKDPRSILKKAELYIQQNEIADQIFFGPEVEFFMFDDVRFTIQPHHLSVQLDSQEGPYNSNRSYPTGNSGLRPAKKAGYTPVGPEDSGHDIRSEMLTTLKEMGIKIEKHHHEVAPSQHELGIRYNTLLKSADDVQLFKYVVRNIAHNYGKSVTFMPKPIYGDNGSGMHVHQSLWKNGQNLFAGDDYAGLSETALYYIGGIIKHARALNIFTNPTANSYKRLVPGYEAPVLLAYSARNRSAACRIPFSTTPSAKRIEVRFPDPTANPYLAYAAMIMAGIDGIRNKISPGQAVDENLYSLPFETIQKIPTVSTSMREALLSLEQDHDFLLQGNVFDVETLQSYMQIKWDEVYYLDQLPHPAEYELYYGR